MNRKHTLEQYVKIIERLKKVKPEIKFSSDFIIGYPGETEEDFEDTLNLIKKVNFINSYSFTYSSRPGTPAAEKSEISKEVAKTRLKVVQNILEKNQLNNKSLYLKKTIEVLFENKLKNQNKYFGRDRYLNSVIVESDEDLTGKIIQIEINDYNHNNFFGKKRIENQNIFAA